MTITEHSTTEPVSVSPVPVVGTPPLRLSWGAIIGGAVAALGVWALLYSLGLALGLTAIDPTDPGSLRPTGIFTSIWSLVAPLVALFVGGVVAGRGAGAISRGSGAVHGLVMWGLTVVAGVWLVGNLASTLVSGATTVGRTATEAVGGVAGSVARVPEMLGLTSDDALARVNARLSAEGKATITAQQLKAAMREALQNAVREGRVNREVLVESLAKNTNLSRADAEDIAGRMGARVDSAGQQIDRTLDKAGTVAMKAAETTGRVFWGVFGALLLGMLAAMGGAIAGVSKWQRRWASPEVPIAAASRFEPPQRPAYP